MPKCWNHRLRLRLLSATLLAGLIAGPCFGADATAGGSPPGPNGLPLGVVLTGPSGDSTTLTAEQLARLPTTQVTVSFGTDHGQRQASFEGPLLWTLLDKAGAVDAKKPRGQVRQTVLITGRDSYTAILALGEIAPEFEGKQVILAEWMDGKALGPEHLRMVVPGDRRGGRSVRDVSSVTVVASKLGQTE